MNIVITGASGFIGTNLLNYFTKKGINVVNIDIKKPRNIQHMQYWRNVNICDFSTLSKVLSKVNPDYLLHLAATTDLNESDGLEYYSSNIKGVENIVKIASECKSIRRVIFASSMLVNTVGYKPKNIFDYNPSTVYGHSKVIGEKIIFSNTSLLPEFCIIRPTSLWGEWFGVPYKNFFDYVLAGDFFHPGDKACTKTYGYIGNTIHQIESILFAKKAMIQEQIFYIGDNPAINISDWANEIATIAGISKPWKIPYVMFVMIGFLGDFLSMLDVKFPITSFRVKNMTTDHILPLENTYNVSSSPPYDRNVGIKRTLSWIAKNTISEK